MKKYSYLCSLKQKTAMGKMKALVFVLAFAVSPLSIMAQGYSYQGVGTNNPQATFHIHSTEEVFFPLPPVGNPEHPRNDGDSINSRELPDPPNPPTTNYWTTLLLTNPNTGIDTSGGFLVKLTDSNVRVSQQELGNLIISNHNANLVFTPNGIGVGGAYNGYQFNINGDARVTGAVRMLSGLTMDGTLKVGSGFKCDAQGNLKVKHLKVTLTDWPDYVFCKEYSLMSLGELETYIDVHRHLPGVPSAEVVEQEGADLGEINKVLMEKVEELTLYIIDLQKQINELKSKNN